VTGNQLVRLAMAAVETFQDLYGKRPKTLHVAGEHEHLMYGDYHFHGEVCLVADRILCIPNIVSVVMGDRGSGLDVFASSEVKPNGFKGSTAKKLKELRISKEQSEKLKKMKPGDFK
jgi:hypothetical protein